MNARPSIRELDRIRRDIGARLRIEHAVTEPAPESLVALLKELVTRVRDAKREKLFAGRCVFGRAFACGRPAASGCARDGNADGTVHTVRLPEVHAGQVR